MNARAWLRFVAARTPLIVLVSLLIGAERAPAAFPPDTTGAQVMLSWNAPPGAPRATSSLLGACGDTTRFDTLYVCAIPGMDSPTLLGFTGEIRFRPAPTESLATFWRAMNAAGELTHFEVNFAPASRPGADSPFPMPGIGRARVDRMPDGPRVRFLFGEPTDKAGPVKAGRIYVLATVRVRRPPARDVACRQVLCAEWVTGTLALQLGYEPAVHRGTRFVGLHAPVERACAIWSRSTARTWTPPPKPRP